MLIEKAQYNTLNWVTSTFTQGNNACVEAALDDVEGMVLMSDTKQKGEGVALPFTLSQWDDFRAESLDGLVNDNGRVEVSNREETVKYGNRTELTHWHVRDIVNGQELHFTSKEWKAFLDGVAEGQFLFRTVSASH